MAKAHSGEGSRSHLHPDDYPNGMGFGRNEVFIIPLLLMYEMTSHRTPSHCVYNTTIRIAVSTVMILIAMMIPTSSAWFVLLSVGAFAMSSYGFWASIVLCTFRDSDGGRHPLRYIFTSIALLSISSVVTIFLLELSGYSL